MPIHALGEHTPEMPPPGEAWVAPGAHVIGQVRLGAGVGVWFGAVLRGDNAAIEVGARSNIQENAVLHVDPGTPLSIGEGVTIGHGAIVHGCTVGDNVLVGMGAVVMNRAVIGADSLVAAAAVVTEGKMFPPGSLIVGSPARVVRALTETEIEGLRRSAAHYVENWKRFAREMRQGQVSVLDPQRVQAPFDPIP